MPLSRGTFDPCQPRHLRCPSPLAGEEVRPRTGGGFGQTLDEQGYRVARCAAVDVLVDLEGVVERVYVLLAPRRVVADPPPPRGGRGIANDPLRFNAADRQVATILS